MKHTNWQTVCIKGHTCISLCFHFPGMLGSPGGQLIIIYVVSGFDAALFTATTSGTVNSTYFHSSTFTPASWHLTHHPSLDCLLNVFLMCYNNKSFTFIWQYIMRNVRQFVVCYLSILQTAFNCLHWYWDNHITTPVPLKQPWKIWKIHYMNS